MKLEHLVNQGKLCANLVQRVTIVLQAPSNQCFVKLGLIVVLQHLNVQFVQQAITVWRVKSYQQFVSQAAIAQVDKVTVNTAFLGFIVHKGHKLQ